MALGSKSCGLRPCNAVLHDMITVEPEHIAYTCVLVSGCYGRYFCLSWVLRLGTACPPANGTSLMEHLTIAHFITILSTFFEQIGIGFKAFNSIGTCMVLLYCETLAKEGQ